MYHVICLLLVFVFPKMAFLIGMSNSSTKSLQKQCKKHPKNNEPHNFILLISTLELFLGFSESRCKGTVYLSGQSAPSLGRCPGLGAFGLSARLMTYPFMAIFDFSCILQFVMALVFPGMTIIGAVFPFPEIPQSTFVWFHHFPEQCPRQRAYA